MPYSSSPKVDLSAPVDSFRLKGKSAIVTGGASGLGAGFVRAIAEAGCRVTIADIDEGKGQQLVNELSKEGLSVDLIKTDVTSFESQAAAFKEHWSTHNGLDIVIPSAGLMGQSILADLNIPLPTSGAIEPVKPPLTVFNVSLVGVYYSACLALHYFALDASRGETDDGSKPADSKQILFISSMMAYASAPLQCEYGAAKYGVRGLWKSLRDDSQSSLPYLRTNLLAPTLTRTPMTEAFYTFLEAKGFAVCQPDDVITAGMRLLCNEDNKGRAVAPLPAPHPPVDLCDDLEGFDGGRETLKLLETGAFGAGPKELGLYKFD